MLNTQLAKQLINMARIDQVMRQKAASDISLWDESIDKQNTKKLKKIISQYGWPTISLVGPEASNMAWLLVQHADHDPEFQQRCLRLMETLTPAEVLPSNVAYLEDRVRVAQGRPQLYATQFDGKDGLGPKSVEDKANLDERRRLVGLSSFEEYKRLILSSQ